MIASNLLLTIGLSKCSKPKRGSCFNDLMLAEERKESKSLIVFSTDRAAPFKSNDCRFELRAVKLQTWVTTSSLLKCSESMMGRL